jgi:anti-sigma factor (TIGR02949 family)
MATPDRYTCEEMFRVLDDYLDRELGEAERTLVSEHLATCVVCAAEYRFEESVLTHLKAKIRRLAMPEDLMRRISRAIEQTRPTGTDDSKS